MERSTYLKNSIKYINLFKNSGKNEANFIRIQRLLWEKSLFPERFHPCSTFLCSICSYKTNDLSFCLKCGQIFCGTHLSYENHHCKSEFGVDIHTHQLFYLEEDKTANHNKYKRRFVFDAYIDKIIFSIKLSVIDGVPIQNDFEIFQVDESSAKSKKSQASSQSKSKTVTSIFPQKYLPIPLQNFGNTCWMNSLLQCLAVNPLLQKWFLSEMIHIKYIDCPEAAVHSHLILFYLFQFNSGTFSMADFILSIWTMSPAFATSDQCDSHEFFMDLRTKLDGYYQKKFDSQIFSSIFNWQFSVIESCENCAETRPFLEPESDLILNIENCSSLNEALSNFLMGSSPKSCSNCQKTCKRQYFFNTLPPTLTIALARASYSDKSVKNVLLQEELSFEDFIIDYKKRELGDSLYSLIGAIVRPGSGETGHYWANVRKCGQWYRCDDNSVTQVSFNDIMRDDACLLFYIRRGFVNS